MKKYSSAAVANALGISEATIESIYEGATKKGLDLAQILTLDDNDKLKRFNDESTAIKKLLTGVKALES